MSREIPAAYMIDALHLNLTNPFLLTPYPSLYPPYPSKMAITWHTAIVRRTASLAPEVRAFYLEVPEMERFDFTPGQFITFDLPVGEKRLQRWRSYSIAGCPGHDNTFELCIVRAQPGLGSRYLFEEVREGTELRFKGPEGSFVLPPELDRDIVMICTGTGIAPFRSMIQAIRRSGRPHGRIHLIFGARTEADILYRSEFEALQSEVPGFSWDVALSRQPDWHGFRGYVHQIYLSAYAHPRPDVTFYLCGWSAMVDEAAANLTQKLGYNKDQVRMELYG